MSPEREPSEWEHVVWDRVCRAATGMKHHEAKAALDDARKVAEDPSLTGRSKLAARAEADEWERITDSLADRAGAYEPATDPFLQGRLAARSDRAQTPTQRH